MIDKPISTLYPPALWTWFEQICAIPHPSKHEAKLKTHIADWAASLNNVDCFEDEIGNLILRKAATLGMDDCKPVVIQAHLDMVPQANQGVEHDFVQDPIRPYIVSEVENGETEYWLTAGKTTLGSDNGIGMASALAIIGADDIAHPALEVLLTVDEEAGMTGAMGLKADTLNAEILINTDSEQEGEIYMGCAGGVDVEITQTLTYQTIESGFAYVLSITGLKGGHSGCNIDLGRANAIKLVTEFLDQYQDALGIQLVEISGGTLRNAIPREAQAVMVISQDKADELSSALDAFICSAQAQYAGIENTITCQLAPVTLPKYSLTFECQQALIQLLLEAPNGVISMSKYIDGVVETSLNLGVVSQCENRISLLFLVRSLQDYLRDQVAQSLINLADRYRAQVNVTAAYPGWQPNPSSEVMSIVRDVYFDLYLKPPEIMVIHAGLECGLFKLPYPEMDMVSIGPTIRFPHSPDEKVNIRTVGLYWQLLLAILERIPKKV